MNCQEKTQDMYREVRGQISREKEKVQGQLLNAFCPDGSFRSPEAQDPLMYSL